MHRIHLVGEGEGGFDLAIRHTAIAVAAVGAVGAEGTVTVNGAIAAIVALPVGNVLQRNRISVAIVIAG